MYTDDQDLLVVPAIEDADAATLGKALEAPPHEVVICGSSGDGAFKVYTLTPARIRRRS